MSDLARFLHILSAALWMGAALYWPGDLRRALEAGAGAPTVALRRARSALALDLGAGGATFLTGGALLSFASPSAFTVWVGLSAILVRVALLLALARPAVRRIDAAAQAGDLVGAKLAAKRIAAYAGVAHLLWLIALAAMVFPV